MIYKSDLYICFLLPNNNYWITYERFNIYQLWDPIVNVIFKHESNMTDMKNIADFYDTRNLTKKKTKKKTPLSDAYKINPQKE